MRSPGARRSILPGYYGFPLRMYPTRLAKKRRLKTVYVCIY